MTEHHPIRDHAIRVWHCPDATPPYRAFIGDGRAFPVFFDAETFSGAKIRAEAFRADVIAKHEKAFLDRQIALEKARAARAKKERAE